MGVGLTGRLVMCVPMAGGGDLWVEKAQQIFTQPLDRSHRAFLG